MAQDLDEYNEELLLVVNKEREERKIGNFIDEEELNRTRQMESFLEEDIDFMIKKYQEKDCYMESFFL